jgi:hypothetical protein
MTARRMTAKRRAAIFSAHDGICHLCGGKIGVADAWDVEHVIALEISRDDSNSNLRPAHRTCHKAKTKDDAKVIAKCRRVSQKHTGARKKKGGIPYRKFDGTAVWPDGGAK